MTTEINPEKNYGICEAAELVHKDRKTLLNWVKNFPKIFPITFDPVTNRKRISGATLIKIRDNQY